jgi:hypothetical protein
MEDLFSNSLVLKVLGGTVTSTDNMCATCRNAMIRVGAYSGRKSVSCSADYYHPIELREPVAQCNRYVDSRRPTIEQMKEIAWELMTNKGGSKIGFRSPDERRQDERKTLTGF